MKEDYSSSLLSPVIVNMEPSVGADIVCGRAITSTMALKALGYKAIGESNRM